MSSQPRLDQPWRTSPMDQRLRCTWCGRPRRRKTLPKFSRQIRASDHLRTSHQDSPSVQELPVELMALINDTTGTLIASHYVNPRTRIACIFGTGCNAAYMEHIKDIPKIKKLGIDEGIDMVINCEWVRWYNLSAINPPRLRHLLLFWVYLRIRRWPAPLSAYGWDSCGALIFSSCRRG